MSLLALPDAIDDRLLDALSPRELLRYSETCSTAYSIVQEYMKHAFCVDRLLSRYFNTAEIIRFRELQYLTGALISGSTAVQFFDRDTYPDSDLDVYVEHKFSRVLAEWLVEVGYKYTPLSQSRNMATLDAAFAANPPELNDLDSIPQPVDDVIFSKQGYAKSSLVLNFKKRDSQCTIQLMTSLTCPLQSILAFHSTCVMNIIAHDKAYSFFPKATFEERLSLRCYRESDASRELASRKYTLRGWSLINLSHTQYPEDVLPFGMRYVGDRACWTLRVHPVLELPRGHVEANSWNADALLRIDRTFPVMKSTIMTAPVLKFSYTLYPREAAIVRRRIWDDMLSLKESSGETSDMDTDYLRALKRNRGDEDKDAEKPEVLSQSYVPLETAFARLNIRYRFRALPRFKNVDV
ncbi:hypothetical protein HYPSUDRAFT_65725 [Hypholoma sublateritium FD-334 SS-4]|uniref:F-box domain-containing protein n=1 Tax=Hypholoma sublateritium (strain FD-334 SS-4) TaxID=945553 RepID=A0A0D2PXW7_HYPSF|nr:hypothetical protein HYPSUDRAFT_65725 [Hypholoma sublateritium FD-334 SS-4]